MARKLYITDAKMFQLNFVLGDYVDKTCYGDTSIARNARLRDFLYTAEQEGGELLDSEPGITFEFPDGSRLTGDDIHALIAEKQANNREERSSKMKHHYITDMRDGVVALIDDCVDFDGDPDDLYIGGVRLWTRVISFINDTLNEAAEQDTITRADLTAVIDESERLFDLVEWFKSGLLMGEYRDITEEIYRGVVDNE